MGLSKIDHLRALLHMPDVARRWRQRHGNDAGEQDVAGLYRHFRQLQLEVIDDFSRLVPGVLDVVGVLRQRGIAIGATTGYFREAAQRVYRAAAEQGYRPDHCVCAEEVAAGRPAPWMVFRIMEGLGLFPPATVVKVGDTTADIVEGLSAGAWSVGVLRSSSDPLAFAQCKRKTTRKTKTTTPSTSHYHVPDRACRGQRVAHPATSLVPDSRKAQHQPTTPSSWHR